MHLDYAMDSYWVTHSQTCCPLLDPGKPSPDKETDRCSSVLRYNRYDSILAFSRLTLELDPSERKEIDREGIGA